MATRKRRPYPTQRYGAAHRALRSRLEPVVQSGQATCSRCLEVIAPGTPWGLDHRDDGKGWLGPSHRSCNRSAGWEKMVDSNGFGRELLLEAPYRWSRRWYEEPPIGTEVLGDGLVEVHIGGGIWQTGR